MLRCPVCGSDKVLGDGEQFYCYDREYEVVKSIRGMLVPYKRFHRVHGPFNAIFQLAEPQLPAEAFVTLMDM